MAYHAHMSTSARTVVSGQTSATIPKMTAAMPVTMRTVEDFLAKSNMMSSFELAGICGMKKVGTSAVGIGGESNEEFRWEVLGSAGKSRPRFVKRC